MTFDSADPAAHAAFWAEALHYVLAPAAVRFPVVGHGAGCVGVPAERRNDRSAIVDPAGVGPRVFFQRVPKPKTAKNRVHLDLPAAAGLTGEARLAALEAECRVWSPWARVGFSASNPARSRPGSSSCEIRRATSSAWTDRTPPAACLLRYVDHRYIQGMSDPLREPTFLILAALAAEPMHGYGMIAEVAGLSGGRLSLRPGTRTGRSTGWSTRGWWRRTGKKSSTADAPLYRLTDAGAAVLEREAARLQDNADAARRRLSRRQARGGIGQPRLRLEINMAAFQSHS